MSNNKYSRKKEGLWIPKIMEEDKNLSIVERCFLAEINSLDNEEGCYASNEHFANWSHLTKNRCSEIITKLIEKNYITRELIYEGKEIKKRILRISKDSYYGTLESKEFKEKFINDKKQYNNLSNGYSENNDRVVGDVTKGYSEKKDRVVGKYERENTINNTNINKNYNKKISADSNYCETFEIIWKNYPNKKGKAIAYKKYLMAVKKYGKDEILNRSRIVIEDYNIQINRKELETKYIPHLSTFFNQERYQDWEVIEEQNKPKRLTKNQMAG